MVNTLDVRGKPMSGVFDVSKDDVITLTVGGVEKASYTADADGKFHLSGIFIYQIDEDALTDAQRAMIIKGLGGKLQSVSVT